MSLFEALRAGPREALERVVRRDQVRLCRFVEEERIWESVRAFERRLNYPAPQPGEECRVTAQANGMVRAAAMRVLQEATT